MLKFSFSSFFELDVGDGSVQRAVVEFLLSTPILLGLVSTVDAPSDDEGD